MKKNLVALFSGILFGLGLAVSEMVKPDKVLNLMDILGNWDPSLAFVMLGALAISLISFSLILKQTTPILETRFILSNRRQVDKPLLFGASIFGIGWGLSGYCPDPVVAALVSVNKEALIMIASMFVGFIVHKKLDQK